MNKQDYQKLIATNASVIYAGWLGSNGATETIQAEKAIQISVMSAKEIAKLAGIPDPASVGLLTGLELCRLHDEQVGMGNSDYKHPNPHVIDLDKDPFCPDWLKVESHRLGGTWAFNPDEIELFVTDEQKKGWVKGLDIENELRGKQILNANVLDYLLAHPELIPENWKGKYVCFWGTIYRDSDGGLYVRYLYWSDGQWRWDDRWLDDDFGGQNPAAVFAS